MNEIDVLQAYSTGVMSRSQAMLALGLDWYGDLLTKLNENDVPRPTVSPQDAKTMAESVKEVFGS